MSQSTSVACRVDEETATRIERFREKRGLEKRGDAVKELIKTGLREQKIPVLYDWQHNAVQASHYLMIAAIVVTVIGLSPAAFGWLAGAWMGGILVVVGLALIAAVEVARCLHGSNEIGEAIRGGQA